LISIPFSLKGEGGEEGKGKNERRNIGPFKVKLWNGVVHSVLLHEKKEMRRKQDAFFFYENNGELRQTNRKKKKKQQQLIGNIWIGVFFHLF